jgi:hypothetical protein
MANVDKPLTPSDVELEKEEEGVDIEFLKDPDLEVDGEGGVVVDFAGKSDEAPLTDESSHYDNLVDTIDESELAVIASDLIHLFNADKLSRADWEKTYTNGLDQLGMKTEERTKPWNGASGVFHPMLIEAVTKFQADAISELLPASGPAKSKIMGKNDKDTIAQSRRVEDELNYQITEKMPEFREEMEQMLFKMALAGSGFKKTYYDTVYNRPASMFVAADDFVISQGASDLQTAPRYAHVIRMESNELRKAQVSGFYADVEVPAPTPDFDDVKRKEDKLAGVAPSVVDDDRHVLLEFHVDLDLPEPYASEDGVALPYVVTVEKSSSMVLSIRRNWDEKDELKIKQQHFTHYKYLPAIGFYGTGLIHLIGGLAKSATSVLRQLIDAGTLSNLPGGLKARGMRITGDSRPIEPGEFRDVDVLSGSIKDSITYLPYKEPSGVLYQLLGNLVEEGRRIGSVADLDIGSVGSQAPVGTTLALMERSLKVMSGVQARLHESMKKELRLIAGVVHNNMGDQYDYDVGGEFSRTEDFDGRVDIIPVSDPNASTMAQRVMQYQAAIQLSAQAPQAYDVALLHRGMLETLNIKNAEDIVKLPDEVVPSDPVTENMAIMKQEAVKAFLYQDHEAHIAVHMAAAQDPKIQQIIGQSPFAQVIQSAMASHITEHVAMQYRKEIEKSLGVPLPDEGQALPEDVEIEVSRLASAAAGKLLGKNKAEAAAEEARKQQADPLTQIQQRELAIKEKKLVHEINTDKEELELKRQKISADELIAKERIKSEERKTGAQIGARMATESDSTQKKARAEGTRLGIEVAKDLSKSALERKRLDIEATRIKTEGNKGGGDN